MDKFQKHYAMWKKPNKRKYIYTFIMWKYNINKDNTHDVTGALDHWLGQGDLTEKGMEDSLEIIEMFPITCGSHHY